MNKKTIKSLIRDKMNNLISLSLSSGVQPEELVSNIYETPYKSISILKNRNNISVELFFEEIDEECPNNLIKVKYIYTYSFAKVLLKIDCVINDRKANEWDRFKAENKLIEEISQLLIDNSLANELQLFVNTLPKKFHSKLLKLIA